MPSRHRSRPCLLTQTPEAYTDDCQPILRQNNMAENQAAKPIKSEPVRESYAQIFREATRLHCEILQRKVMTQPLSTVSASLA
jgi:hypothetical protein